MAIWYNHKNVERTVWLMKIKIREQAGTDAVRKFDYQMAVALDYLLSGIDSDVIVLIETLEDFAVFRNFGSDSQTIDVYQVKTKDKGVYSKSMLNSDNVIGKIILTDFYFDSKANTLNIICNTSLKGKSTEEFDSFSFTERLTPKELAGLKSKVKEYLSKHPEFIGNIDDYCGKLIYIKSQLPFSGKEDRYIETLIGKTNNTIAHYLDDENHNINPQAVFNTLKIIIDKQRRNKITTPEIELEDAFERKGISTVQLKEVIDKAAEINHLSKVEILQHAAAIFSPQEFLAIKQEYSAFLSYRDNLTDQAFIEAKNIVEEEYKQLTTKLDSLDEVIRQVSYNCTAKISYYSLPVIQILTIIVVYS